MGNIFQDPKQKIYIDFNHVYKDATQAYTMSSDKLKASKYFCTSFYCRKLTGKFTSKFVQLGMILPVALILLSGFIGGNRVTGYGFLPNSNGQLYPLSQNIMSIVPVPSSGMIAIHDVSSLGNIKKGDFVQDGSLETTSVKSEVNPEVPAKSEVNPEVPATTAKSKMSRSYAQRKKLVTPYVKTYARKYGLDSNMVLAIIYAESGFSPNALSKKNAHGLMQIVPTTAGIEVHRFFKKKDELSTADLMHPETNIRYGTAYLYLLKKYHLTGIEDPRIKNLLAIASYNAGSSAVLRHFAKNRAEAIELVNEMTFDDVFTTIVTSYRSRETRKYVQKVLGYMGSI